MRIWDCNTSESASWSRVPEKTNLVYGALEADYARSNSRDNTSTMKTSQGNQNNYQYRGNSK